MRHLTRSIGCAALLLFVTGIGFCQATWTTGDVFVAVGNGQYNVYRNTDGYLLLETLNDGSGGVFNTGCTFDANGNLFTTNFSNTKVYKFSPNSTSPSATIDTSAHDTGGDSESVVIDSSGNLYVGDADGSRYLQKYDSSGNFIRIFSPNPQDRGTDWIDLASDQKTLFYTSEGTNVKRFDVSAGAQLTDFSTALTGAAAYAMRLLPPFDGTGGLLVADTDAIRRLDGSGNVIQTYTAANETAWFGLALDPNGTSFWAQDLLTGHLYRFNIATGAIEVPAISTGSGAVGTGGICVKGQGSATLVTSYTTPPQTTAQGGSNQFTDPGGSGTQQTYAFPATTTFQNGSNSCSSPTMAIQFQYWDPGLFNSSRLPGIPQNPNWCSVPGNPGLACTTPVPTGTTCAQLSVNNKNVCIVEEAQCSCGGTQIAQCNVTGVSGPILVSNANNNFVSPTPTNFNPGLVIGDDGQNDWAMMPQSPDGSTCISPCTTQKLNTDITILNVNQPDFSFSASPSTLSLGVGASGTSIVSLSALNGFSSPVTLSVPTPPAGVSTTFSLSPVTPPASPASTSSTMTVSLGPSVTPTSFTLNVNGLNGSLSHYAFVTVNVTASTSSITSVIGSFIPTCIDNSGIGNALDSKLSAAQSFINVGNNQDAINTLTAFNNQVKAQTGKHIYSSCVIGGVTIYPGTVLTTDAQSLINTLRTGTIADPITGYTLNSSNAGLQGATVAIYAGTSASGTPIATAITDVTGFYYFATTNLLTSGSAYTIAVSAFPSGYTKATPTYSTFTWTGVGFGSNFTLN
jgi:sugar lactone lactonase YvrE